MVKSKGKKQEVVAKEVQKEAGTQVATPPPTPPQEKIATAYNLEELASYIDPIISEIDRSIKRGDSDSLASLYQTLNAMQQLYSRVCFFDDMIKLSNPELTKTAEEAGEGEEGTDDGGPPAEFLEKIAKQTEDEAELEKKRKSIEDYIQAGYHR